MRDLAQVACLSTSALGRLFRDVAGLSPQQFVQTTRLERARQMLLAEEGNIGDISQAVGYCSVSHFSTHFSTQFRRQFGASPRPYASARRDRTEQRQG